MASINKALLIGHLGADPDVRYMTDGSPVATVNLATRESWKDKNTGQNQEKTEWHRLVFFRRLADIAGQYLKKGSHLYVEGKLQTRRWTDPQGVERYTTEIVVNELRMLGKKSEMASPTTGPTASRPPSHPTPRPAAAFEPAAAGGAFDDPGRDKPRRSGRGRIARTA